MFTKHFLFTITKYLSQKYKFKTLDVVFNDVVLMKIKIYKRFYNRINSFLKGLLLTILSLNLKNKGLIR
ncbi:MAG: hypothetical protein RLZZ414_385 [Bacteroidota bacterium]|jgi:hypothetical protein